MATLQSTLVMLKAAAPKIDDALEVLEEAYNKLDNTSRCEELQDVLLELSGLLNEATSLQSSIQSVIETYGDE